MRTCTLRCNTIGCHLTWSSFPAAIKRCPNPEDIDHGSVRVIDSTRYSSPKLNAWYSCDRGYALSGQSRRDCDLLTGEWEGPAPTCEQGKWLTHFKLKPLLWVIHSNFCYCFTKCRLWTSWKYSIWNSECL